MEVDELRKQNCELKRLLLTAPAATSLAKLRFEPNSVEAKQIEQWFADRDRALGRKDKAT